MLSSHQIIARLVDRRRARGERGSASVATIFQGEGWRLADILCSADASDAAFEEQHDYVSIALVMAAMGIYGVISYSVAQRTRELGIRIALGAQRSDVLRLILRQGMTLVAAGVVFGVAASLGLTRLIASLLYGISASDPITFFLLSTALVLVAFIACWLPARRASAVDPIVALHAE